MLIVGNGGHGRVVREVIAASKAHTVGNAFVAIGDNRARAKEAAALGNAMFSTLIHPSAVVSASAKVGEGTIIMAGVVVQANAVIGKHVILNTGCSVDHDCVIEDYAHIAPGARLCGNVRVGEGALVGVCVGVEPGVTIPPWATVKRGRYEVTLQRNG